MTTADLTAWAAAPDHVALTFRVSDRFGDSGLTGLVGLEIAGAEARLVHFLLSCRVMGRRVEDTMLHVAISQARLRGASRLVARFVPTPRNGPCLVFFRRSGLTADADTFTWNTAVPYERPSSVTVSEPA
jgi:FkbH-like protein